MGRIPDSHTAGGNGSACARLRALTVAQDWSARLARVVIAVLAGVAVLQMLGSLVAPFPQLPTMESQAFGSLGAYLRSALGALFTPSRLTGFDHLTFTSLWGGFGWVDAMLPDALLALTVLGATGALLTWAVTHNRVVDAKPLGWLLLVLAGGVASAAAVCVAAFLMGRNLHGRYLLPLAIPLVSVVVSGMGAALGRAQRHEWRWAAVLWVALIHGASFVCVASRYF